MKFNYDLKTENKILYIHTEGAGASLPEVKVFSKKMFELCLKNNCNKILADDRDQDYSLRDSDLYELGEFHAGILPAIIKFAVVCKEEDLKNIKLWENVACNRGSKIKCFSDVESAEKWLNSV